MAQIMALGDMASEQRERLSVIRKSGEALLEILNDILDVSKIEAGKLELDIIEPSISNRRCAAPSTASPPWPSARGSISISS